MKTVVSTFCDCLKMFDCIRCISLAIRDAIAQLEKLILAMEKGKIELNCGSWLMAQKVNIERRMRDSVHSLVVRECSYLGVVGIVACSIGVAACKSTD